MQRIYQGIDDYFYEDQRLVRNAFGRGRLIHVGSAAPDHWIGMNGCRWTKPEYLREIIALSDVYPSLHQLFHFKLGLRNATGLDVAQELGRLSGDLARYDEIKELLLWLGSYVDRPEWNGQIPQILGNKTILPVKQVKIDLRAPDALDWFIADTEKMERSFKGKVALLDFSVDEISKLQKLLEKLLVQRRALSLSCRERYDLHGSRQLHGAWTNSLRSKAVYVSW